MTTDCMLHSKLTTHLDGTYPYSSSHKKFSLNRRKDSHILLF